MKGEPVRLLMVTTVPQTLRAFLLPFAKYFREIGWQVDAMSSNVLGYSDISFEFSNIIEINFSRNPFSLRNVFFLSNKIRHHVLKEKYDLVHVHSPVASFVTRFALRKITTNRPKIIYTAHGFHFHRNGNFINNIFYLLLEKIAGIWTDLIIVINEEDKNYADKYNLAAKGEVEYIPGIGIDTKKYNADTIDPLIISSIKNSLGLNANDQYFLMIAEFTPQKNHAIAIKAFNYLQNPNIHLVFAGTGKTFIKMKQLAKKNGLQDRIHFLGFRDDIPELIAGSIGVLLLSDREGLPRSIMEAMCMKKPIIGSNTRGITDLIKSGAGIILKQNCPIALLEALKFIIEHPQERIRMAEKGFTEKNRYHITNILELYKKTYERLIKKGSTSNLSYSS